MHSAQHRTDDDGPARTAASADAQEVELLARVAARDHEAMREFYLLYHRRLARFVVRITRRHELIEEIVNDTLLIVWRRAADFRGYSRVSTWVMGIAWRTGLKSVQREQRAAAYPVLPEDTVALEEDTHASRDALERAMIDLSPEQRAVIELAYVGGYSCEEIGAIMGCPANTVKTRLFHARRKMRTALDEPPQAARMPRQDRWSRRSDPVTAAE
jgi:RNA polymerase sigma-70 factor (ECF subfamily)